MQRNANIFAWSYEDMLGIYSNMIAHHLNVDLQHRPIKQKCRSFNSERYEAIKMEVDKLLKEDFI